MPQVTPILSLSVLSLPITSNKTNSIWNPMTEAAEKKDVQKLQRSIIDSLEDVKAQEIVVFNTEHLSSLFERVVIASGTSNRQTKALAASVRDGVRDAGFAKPRMEGEDNGEWIIVDCGSVVVHIMQPAIRTYYHLEEIWGEKPVRIKLGAPKPIIEKPPAVAKTVSAKPGAKKTAAAKKSSTSTKTPAVKKTPAATKAPAVKKRPAAPRKK
jgi:ribosome-associated protein